MDTLAFQTVKVHRRHYERDEKQYPCQVEGCSKAYVQYPQLRKHYETKHINEKIPLQVTRPRKIEKHAKKGRPKSQIRRKSEDITPQQQTQQIQLLKQSTFPQIQLDDLEEKNLAIQLYQNNDFCQMLVNIMFSEGYLSKPLEIEGSNEQPLMSQSDIMSFFRQLSIIFDCHNEVRTSNILLVSLEFISSMVFDAAYILIFYCLFIGGSYQSLLDVANTQRDIDPRFQLLAELLEKETQDSLHQELIKTSFNDLTIALQRLNNNNTGGI